MKWAASLLLIVSVSSLTSAQTVSGRAPVVVPAQYVSSTSPMHDGRTVQAVYTADSNKTVTVIAEPYRVPKGSPIQGSSNGATRWKTVEPRYVVGQAPTSPTTTAVVPVQPVPPSVNRLPVSTSAVSPAIVYYVQENDGQVVQIPANAAPAPPTSVYDVIGAGVEVQQAPACGCAAAPIGAAAPVVAVAPPYKVHKPVLPIRRNINGAYVSQGLWGQPKAYVTKEPVRNFFRYILP